MREVVAECERPVMLYSIGKDSAVMLHLAKKAFYPSPAAVPAAACRHDLEVPRHVRVARPAWRKKLGIELLVYQNPEASRRASIRSTTARDPHRHVEDRRPEAGARQVSASTRLSAARGATRRRAAPRSASSRFRSRAASLGPEEPAPGALESLQRAQAQGREHPRVPDLELDRARHLAVHPSRRHRDRAAVLLAPSVRSSSATAR